MSKIEEQMEECYQHMKPYMKNMEETKELRDMCASCDGYCGDEHEFNECREKPCFKLWLGWQYLDWMNSYS